MAFTVDPSWKAGELYGRLKDADLPMEEKVRIILRHYGWTGKPRPEAEPVLKAMKAEKITLFPLAQSVIEQFYGLKYPYRSTLSPIGGHLWFDFAINSDTALSLEVFSLKYHDRCVPIANLGYSKDSWEGLTATTRATIDFVVEYYLGESGKVYFYSGISLLCGVAEQNLLEFFAVCFGLIPKEGKVVHPDGTSDDDDYIEDELWDMVEYGIEDGSYTPKYHLKD